MKRKLLTLALALCGAVASTENASSATTYFYSFEESEGFNIGSNATNVGTPARLWGAGAPTLGGAGRVLVTDAYFKSGASSLMMASGSPTVTTIALFNVDEPLTEVGWSFINPTATYATSTTVAWMYIRLHDEASDGLKYIQLSPRYTSTDNGQRTIQYGRVGADGVVTNVLYTDSQGLLNPWDTWNDIVFKLNTSNNTYAIQINGVIPTALSAISLGSWDVSTIEGTWLNSPGVGAVYYDDVYAIPEPSSLGLVLAAAGLGALLRRAREERHL